MARAELTRGQSHPLPVRRDARQRRYPPRRTRCDRRAARRVQRAGHRGADGVHRRTHGLPGGAPRPDARPAGAGPGARRRGWRLARAAHPRSPRRSRLRPGAPGGVGRRRRRARRDGSRHVLRHARAEPVQPSLVRRGPAADCGHLPVGDPGRTAGGGCRAARVAPTPGRGGSRADGRQLRARTSRSATSGRASPRSCPPRSPRCSRLSGGG